MSDAVLPDPFHNRPEPLDRGGPEFGRLVAAFRVLQDRFSAALPPDDAVPGLASRLEALADELRQWEVVPGESAAGTRHDIPGRGHPMLLPLIVDEWTDTRVRGSVTFTRAHLGGNGAAHGGMLPLLFDEVLGRLANSGERPTARTAYITVSYRVITRIGVEHRIEADIDRIDGRKRWVTGRLVDPAGMVVSDAEGLFVELRPGQP